MEKDGQKQTFSFKKFISSLLKPQLIKFCIVGSSGILVDLGVLWFAVEYLHLWYIYGSGLGIICSVTTNFIFNKFWTFERRSLLIKQVFIEYSKYWLVSLLSIIAQVGMLYTLVEFVQIWYILAALIGIGCGFLINFIGNKFWTFGYKGFISEKY